MNDKRISEIEEIVKIHGNGDESFINDDEILYLIQALRDERLKNSNLYFESERRQDEVIRLCNVLKDERLKVVELENWFNISKNKLKQEEKTTEKLRKEIHSLQRQL